jgi:O-antigen/teichoic acid export membrane protein
MNEPVFGARNAVRQGKVVAVSKVGSAMMNLVAQIMIVRHLNIPDYATFTLFIAAASLVVLLSMYGLDRVCYRVVPPLRMQDRWREIAAVIGASLALRLFLIAMLMAVWVSAPPQLTPGPLASQMGIALAPLIAFISAMAITDSLSIFCNGVGRQAAQSRSLLLIGVVRSILIIVLTSGPGSSRLPLEQLLWLFAGAEFVFATMLAGVLVQDLFVQNSRASHQAFAIGYPVTEMFKIGGMTQLSYLLRVPFGGPLLRILVGSFAPPIVTAAYGFFQTLSDRVYQFLPPIMLKGVIEPALAANYSQGQGLRNVTNTVAILTKLSFLFAFAALAMILGLGEPLIDLITANRYGSESMVAALVCVQLIAQVVGEVLWIAFNPVGRVNVLNRAWYCAAVAAGLGMIVAYLGQQFYGLLIVAPLPYIATAIWLRWYAKEPVMTMGIGFESAPVLFVSAGVAALVAHMFHQVLGAGSGTLVIAALSVAVLYTASVASFGVFTAHEMRTAQDISPKLSRALRLFSSRR